MKCDKCGYDDKGTGDFAHACQQPAIKAMSNQDDLVMIRRGDLELELNIIDFNTQTFFDVFESVNRLRTMLSNAPVVSTQPIAPSADDVLSIVDRYIKSAFNSTARNMAIEIREAIAQEVK